MVAIHAKYATLALNAINKHGRDITLVRFQNTGNDQDPELTEEYLTIRVLQSEFTVKELSAGNILESDIKYITPAGVTFSSAMRLRDYSPITTIIPTGEWRAGVDYFGAQGAVVVLNDYSIEEINELKPGETSILVKLRARL